MRSLAAILLAGGVFALCQFPAAGQKGKNQGTPATAEFDFGWADSAVVSGGPYAGVVNGGFNASTTGEICFASGTFLTHGPGGDPSAPLPSECGTNVGFGVHPFGGLAIGEEGARQVTISWTDDDNGYVYRLQFGDAYANPPNYARVTCLEILNGTCVSADVDSLTGLFPSQSGELRDTGPAARLTVTVGRGSRGVKAVGLYSVPFKLTITPMS